MNDLRTSGGNRAAALAVAVLLVIGAVVVAGTTLASDEPAEILQVSLEPVVVEPTESAADAERIIVLHYRTTTSSTDPDLASGRLTGDYAGRLHTRLVDIDQSESVWLVTYEWTFDGGADSFTAHLTGTFDSEKDILLLRGTVDEGRMAGATLEGRGVLRNVATGFHEGDVRITGAVR